MDRSDQENLSHQHAAPRRAGYRCTGQGCCAPKAEVRFAKSDFGFSFLPQPPNLKIAGYVMTEFEKLKLPPEIADLRIENGELVATFR